MERKLRKSTPTMITRGIHVVRELFCTLTVVVSTHPTGSWLRNGLPKISALQFLKPVVTLFEKQEELFKLICH